MEKRQPLEQMLLGKLDKCIQKTETRFMSLTLYKYQLKVEKLRPVETTLRMGRIKQNDGGGEFN
jgi:hypothetical protein